MKELYMNYFVYKTFRTNSDSGKVTLFVFLIKIIPRIFWPFPNKCGGKKFLECQRKVAQKQCYSEIWSSKNCECGTNYSLLMNNFMDFLEIESLALEDFNKNIRVNVKKTWEEIWFAELGRNAELYERFVDENYFLACLGNHGFYALTTSYPIFFFISSGAFLMRAKIW